MPALQEFHHSTLYLIRAETAVINLIFNLYDELQMGRFLKISKKITNQASQ
jgi:hypothetical protein